MPEPELQDIPVGHLTVVRDDVAAQKEEAQGTLQLIGKLPIEHQEDLDFAGEMLTEIKGKVKALEDRRGKATRGLLDSLNVIRSWFKPPLTYYGQCEIALKRKISDYTQARRREQEEALRVAGQASMQGNAQVAQQALQAASDAQVHKVAGVTMRDVVKFEVFDSTQVPRQFLCVNNAAIQQYIQANGADVQIPGVRIYKDTQIAARAR